MASVARTEEARNLEKVQAYNARTRNIAKRQESWLACTDIIVVTRGENTCEIASRTSRRVLREEQGWLAFCVYGHSFSLLLNRGRIVRLVRCRPMVHTPENIKSFYFQEQNLVLGSPWTRIMSSRGTECFGVCERRGPTEAAEGAPGEA